MSTQANCIIIDEHMGMINLISRRRPTKKCLEYRRNGGIDRCSDTLEDRLGDEDTGACDQDMEFVHKLISRGLGTMAESQAANIRSPAFEFLKFVTFIDISFFRGV